ncbi:plasmid replication protein [Clostridium botulinum]|uniref:plasmid replication protein n=1 Tax=Clostridium botulinum TaxID=1491 RepID=UPI001E29D743|nr:plasmid replication protein [Clostridium botulinum]MCD3223924.1 plasmid replication protein [Clostridium botulinum C/D]MCD3297944.1 plasmid replication protein [Clostridium botulinum C/D]
MCKNYGNDNFKKYTLYQFNSCFKDGKVKNSLMGFYSWLIRISKDNSINISKDLLTKLWNRKQSKKASKEKTAYKKVNASTVLRWIHKLEKAKLLFVDRNNSTNKYLLNADGSIHPNIFSPQKKCTEKCTTEKRLKDVATTSVQELDDVYKNNKLNTINKDIDIHNSKQVTETAMTDEVYHNYLRKQEKVSSMNELLNIAEKMFKIMRVRSGEIKTDVMNVLNYWETVTKKGAYNYVKRAIENARERYYRKRNKRHDNNSNTDFFNDYEQRDYDYDVLEKQLLGLI